ncbi:MAG: response regulator [Candidatus Wallbacteria bacterium]|nr:response regulator [Candidatus Wallbacteria bacterium]
MKRTLLVVDDEKPILDSLTSLFRRVYDVVTAPSGLAGLEVLRARTAHIVLSDQRMPDMTGDEFLSRARELAPDSVRILFTGYADVEAVTRAVNRGKIYGYIAKPWNSSDLETLVHQAAQHYELAEANRRLTGELQEMNQQLERKVVARTRELEELEDYKESLLRSLGWGMLVVDLGGTVKSFNPAAEVTLGFTASQAQGHRYTEVPGLAPFFDELARSLATGKAGAYQETETTTPTRHTLYLGFVVNPLVVHSGERKGSIVSFSDITEKRQMEMQLNQTEKLSTIGQLAGGVAHEINNPLGVILGFTQILLKQAGFTDQNVRRLQNVERQALRCKDIVSSLLKFARRSKMQVQPLQVNHVVEETLALMGRQLEMENIRLERDLAPDLPDIGGDENELEQVFFNLIVNARHALAGSAPENQDNLVLTVRSRLADGWVEVRVDDTGPGIPLPMWEKIFDPFFTTKEPGQGTGLGLSVSRGIVKRHGGDLRLEQSSERGSTFLVRLPVPARPISPIFVEPAPHAEAAKGLRILVVDDEEDIREICADYLSEQNEVTAVGSGMKALEALATRDYGLVLLDVMMPELDGIATLERMRKMGVASPVVIMTGKADERIMSAQQRLNILEILEKPFSISELERVLERVTRGK